MIADRNASIDDRNSASLCFVAEFAMLYPLNGFLAGALRTLCISLCIWPIACAGQTRNVVCDGGFGTYQFKFKTGVTVWVGPQKTGGFAARACEARLEWGQQNMVAAPISWQVDIDALGIDLGLGAPVVAFQTKKTDIDGFMQYEIYSLKKPPQLLRVITGGDWYSAADTDLDGRVEIWTDDARTIRGFDNLPPGAFDFAPPVVLRFEKKKLIDVSAEFQPNYDRRIAAVRAQLDTKQLSDFKASDGKLRSLFPPTPEEWEHLQATKTKVLEIVWCYLYSGRDRQAWDALQSMWPPTDIDRIRAIILSTRAQGIRREVEGVSSGLSAHFKTKKVTIFDPPSEIDPRSNDLAWAYAPGMSGPGVPDRAFNSDSFPVKILMERPVPPEGSEISLRTEVPVELVIDSAGKIRSAKAIANPDNDLVQATAGWKFVPAFRYGHPVASRIQMGITPQR
jgi:hypothetical protein